MKKLYNLMLDGVFFVLKGIVMLVVDVCKAVYKFGKYFYDGIFTK